MSIYDYRESIEITHKDYAFYSLLMALMRKADSINAEKLKAMWPDVWDELDERYNAPGGLINDEIEY